MNYLKNVKISITPLNIVLLVAVSAGLIYTIIYIGRIVSGAGMPSIPDSYVEDQVKSSFEVSKFNAKIEDPKIEKNLFHPDRKPVRRVALMSSVNNPQIVLYGTFITPGLQMAYLEDAGNPQMTSSGERRQQALKKGDMISGFVLKEIYPEKVLLVRNSERIFIQLSQNKAPRENMEKQPKAPPTTPFPQLPKPQLKEQTQPPQPLPAEENN